MNATSTLRPSASSPFCVQGPSARTWPFFTWSPFATRIFWLIAGRRVRAHELAHRVNGDAVRRVMLDLLLAFGQVAVFSDDDLVTVHGCHFAGFFRDEYGAGIAGDTGLPCPSRPAAPRSRGAARPGVACWNPSRRGSRRSCSRNGINEAAIGDQLAREMSMKSTFVGSTR